MASQNNTAPHPMKDWNHQLRLNGAACVGARQLYHHIGHVYGMCQDDFKTLPAAKMDALILDYAALIERHKPERPNRPPSGYFALAVDGARAIARNLRPTHAPVIAAIAPTEEDLPS